MTWALRTSDVVVAESTNTRANAYEYYRYDGPIRDHSFWETPTIKAQVVHAVRHEMAHTVADVVLRRIDLATGRYPRCAALEECGQTLRTERSLRPEEIARQIEIVTARFPKRALRESDPHAAVRCHAGPVER